MNTANTANTANTSDDFDFDFGATAPFVPPTTPAEKPPLRYVTDRDGKPQRFRGGGLGWRPNR
jgi:hypothetical protein